MTALLSFLFYFVAPLGGDAVLEPAALSLHVVNIDVEQKRARAMFEGIIPTPRDHTAYEYAWDADDPAEYYVVIDQPIITSSDLQQVFVDPAQPTIVSITLTEDGGRKMEAATLPLANGKAQLATVIDGEMVQVATLMADHLERQFQLSGLMPDEAQKLAARLNLLK